MRTLTLAELMRATQGEAEEKEAGRPLPEAQVATLIEEFERYAAACPFKPGDIITPRATSSYRDRGVPHIVLEVAETPIRVFDAGDDLGDIHSTAFGQRLDIRVGVLSEGYLVTFWQESWRHERYTGPMPHLAG